MKNYKTIFLVFSILVFTILVVTLWNNDQSVDNSPSTDNNTNYSTIDPPKEDTPHPDEEFLKELFHAKEIESFFQDNQKFPMELSILVEGLCNDDYAVPVGYSMEKCEDKEIGSHGACETCNMKIITLSSSNKLPNTLPSFIKSAESTDKIAIGWYNYNPNSDSSYCDLSYDKRQEIAGYDENYGLGLFSYKQHIGGGYGTYVKFDDEYYLEYIGLRFSAGAELIDDLYLEFFGTFPFTSSKASPKVKYFDFIPTASACSFVDVQGIGSYILSSELEFIKEEKGVRWYSPKKKIKVDSEIGNMQISLYKKEGGKGVLIVGLDNIIFSKDNTYIYPVNIADEEGWSSDMKRFEGYNQAKGCQFGNFYYGIFPGIERGNLSFRYDNESRKVYFIVKNVGEEDFIIDYSSINALMLTSITLFSGNDLNGSEELMKINMRQYDDFANQIRGEKLSPGEILEIPYDLTLEPGKVLSAYLQPDINRIDSSFQYRDIQWSIGDPYVYYGDRIKIY
jgi:hypothetical protein